MKVLIIGGTGTISMAITRQLAQDPLWDVYLLNRGHREFELPHNVTLLRADYSDEAEVRSALRGRTFDCVCQFIGFKPDIIRRDIQMFSGVTGQYIFISSASAYHKPALDYMITEGTTLYNPFWAYSRDKIACEEILMAAYRQQHFPVTIVRPSHTYDERKIPVGLHGAGGTYQVVRRMLAGKPVIIHGDGTSLWTMTFNTDFAAGYVGLLNNPLALGEVFQITSGESLTWNAIYSLIARTYGVELRCRHISSEFLAKVSPYDLRGSLLGDKANSVIFDQTKLKRAVPDFVPRVPLHRGIAMAADYIKQHPELQTEDPAFDRWCDSVIAAVDDCACRLTGESCK